MPKNGLMTAREIALKIGCTESTFGQKSKHYDFKREVIGKRVFYDLDDVLDKLGLTELCGENSGNYITALEIKEKTGYKIDLIYKLMQREEAEATTHPISRLKYYCRGEALKILEAYAERKRTNQRKRKNKVKAVSPYHALQDDKFAKKWEHEQKNKKEVKYIFDYKLRIMREQTAEDREREKRKEYWIWG